jgi:diguanylate cyclase (GGDEF)-like protein
MKRAQDLLTQKAQVDALTGLHNRAFLDELLATSISHSARNGRPLSLVMMDLDNFKSLNDTYGHPFGDLVLQRVGDLLSRSTRPADTACRYGGEEIAIVLADTDADGALVVAERLRGQLQLLDLSPRGKPVVISASFGVAEALTTTTAGEELRASVLIAAADAALYVAKNDGRNCVRRHGDRTEERRPSRLIAV